ncbi:MAG: alcohol dehydrogenase catalytic domain-containing protein [Anaerolineales bacterium]|nr:alcohol dehydrogenase catalytic domain-containing protein [Anaerolineales bacterium]
MLALVLDNGKPVLTEVPRPERGPNEALVRISLAGICATDLEMISGYKADFQGILGHEFVGIVAGADDKTLIDRRVVGEINIGCGICDFCLNGLANHCRSRLALGMAGYFGAFAEYLLIPQSNLFLVPDTLSDAQAVFTEPLAAALQVLNLVHVRPIDRVGIIGDGKLGLLVAQVLATICANVTLMGRHEERLAMAAAWGIHSGRPDDYLDVVVECTGNIDGFRTALELVRPLGTIVLKSTYAGLADVDLTRVVVDEIKIIGNRCGAFEPALRLLKSGRIKTKELIEASYPLTEGMMALEHAGRPGTLKILIQP